MPELLSYSHEPETPLIRVEHLVKHFPLGRGTGKGNVVQAVSDVSFHIRRHETLGVVGESGCGKSTTGRLVLQLLKATSGAVFFEDRDLCRLSSEELRRVRLDMRMIFQDPFSSLDPRQTVERIIAEPMEIAGIDVKQRREIVRELLPTVGLADYHATRYPHEFSGGQRQRIGIARALVLNPKFIVCDEPVSALDVSVQAQILNLLKELQEKFSLTYMFISHDLAVVRHISDRVAVMYLGKLMELADKKELFMHPLHPYTLALLSAIPNSGKLGVKRILLDGALPSPADPPTGCRFHTRCWKATAECREVEPEWREVCSGHGIACHNV